MEQERLALLALRLIPGVGDKLFKHLIETIGSASEVFRLPASRLMRIEGIGPRTAKAVRNAKTFQEAENQFLKAEQNQTRICIYSDPSYPRRLSTLSDAPTVLFIKGNVNLNQKRIVAVVGTRRATAYGKGLTHELIKGLKPYEPVVISGLAYGIDIQAHLSCLQVGLPTIGVLGSGIDTIYPNAHRNTAQKMLSCGGLITEEPFGSGPDAHHFPARNRIIAGLSDALVVIEAGEKGGALITADIMNSYNRDVFAFPGSLFNPWSAGCHHLIKSHQAQLITGVEDLIGHLNWDSPKVEYPSPISQTHADPYANSILAAFTRFKPMTIDDLQYLTGLPLNTLSSRLLQLELEGKLNALPGNSYQLSKG
ncbi:MAG: DNA-processing protein DprA [Cyclobacteriaceae bacterium]